MEIIDIVLVALVTIYIVDLSGFTDTWLSFLSAYKGRKVNELKPFSCSLCMVWWVCLIYVAIVGRLTIPMVALIAFLSFLSNPLGQLLILARETINAIINRLMDKL